jgi:hypothetical protein
MNTIRFPTRQDSTCFVQNPQRSKGGICKGLKNKDQNCTSERAHESIKRVTYLKYSRQAFSNAPRLDVSGAELTEIDGGGQVGGEKAMYGTARQNKTINPKNVLHTSNTFPIRFPTRPVST